MDLESALREFEAADTNVQRLSKVWDEMAAIVPAGITFMTGSPEERRYEELRWAFNDIASTLPAFDGWNIKSRPWALDAIAQARLDGNEIGEIDFLTSTERDVAAPGLEVAEYQIRLNRARRALVRNRIWELVTIIDGLLPNLLHRWDRNSDPITDPEWDQLRKSFTEIERLAGNIIPRKGRWRELNRHVHWAQGQDIHDIAGFDWPSVRKDLESGIYSELEPVPVHVADLGVLVGTKPAGPVSTELAWKALTAEDFERLLYNILQDATDYENPQWLMHTNAPDRGRDLSVTHRTTDSLSGNASERIIVQARHWPDRAIRPRDISAILTDIQHWEPPPIQVLIVATTGRFSADAVAWTEKRNGKGERPRVEMWPSSHLESLLARRPQLIAEFRLRPS